ncbi:VOC family protein [Dyella solisilvae]|uniref:VOC family protein n=1 Tax=Dyella solisilvae TaxID=1920168 RepID=A0A370K7Q1_9GAMM|nr:VOC family protein [Dyella solisilvae]RDI98675.1 VOC family protein [Dyella solisilvae]
MSAEIRASRDVIVRTERWGEAMAFYGEVLGLAMTPAGDALARFETGAFALYVERGSAHGPVFEFLVDDVAATRDRLLAAGCTLVEEDASVPRCYLRDPFGLIFNLGRASA